jgi:vancomycin resistance protein YoaR
MTDRTASALQIRSGRGALEREELEQALLGGRRRTLRVPWGPLLGIVVSCAVVAGLVALDRHEGRPLDVAGVTYLDQPVEAFVEGRAMAWLSTEVTLDVGSALVRLPRRELGVTVDLERTALALRRARGEGHLARRVVHALTGPGDRVPLAVAVDEELLAEALDRIALEARVPPVPEGPNGEPARVGLTVEVTAGLGALTQALLTGDVVAALPVHRLAPPARQIPLAELQYAQFDRVVGRYETRFTPRGASRGRAMNIELAARLIDGFILGPDGGRLSFNEVVGERSVERGFMPAQELRNGRRIEGVGGGICQVAATLHAAALYGGLAVPVHHPHTRTSSYIDEGLDSAVSWPSRDLVIENPYPHYVKVRARARSGRLEIRLLGNTAGPSVEIRTQEIQRTPRETEVVVDADLPAGVEVVEDEGVDGMVVERIRIVRRGRRRVEEQRLLRYPMVSRLVRTGPPGLLPPGGESP